MKKHKEHQELHRVVSFKISCGKGEISEFTKVVMDRFGGNYITIVKEKPGIHVKNRNGTFKVSDIDQLGQKLGLTRDGIVLRKCQPVENDKNTKNTKLK